MILDRVEVTVTVTSQVMNHTSRRNVRIVSVPGQTIRSEARLLQLLVEIMIIVKIMVHRAPVIATAVVATAPFVFWPEVVFAMDVIFKECIHPLKILLELFLELRHELPPQRRTNIDKTLILADKFNEFTEEYGYYIGCVHIHLLR